MNNILRGGANAAAVDRLEAAMENQKPDIRVKVLGILAEVGRYGITNWTQAISTSVALQEALYDAVDQHPDTYDNSFVFTLLKLCEGDAAILLSADQDVNVPVSPPYTHALTGNIVATLVGGGEYIIRTGPGAGRGLNWYGTAAPPEMFDEDDDEGWH